MSIALEKLLQKINARQDAIEEKILPGPLSENSVDLFYDLDFYNHCDIEVILNETTETLFDAIKPNIKEWLDNNIVSWIFDETIGEFGSFVFLCEEDVMAFILRWG